MDSYSKQDKIDSNRTALFAHFVELGWNDIFKCLMIVRTSSHKVIER